MIEKSNDDFRLGSSHYSGLRDHHGRPVPEGETQDTVITVWEIDPAENRSFDYAVVRGS